MKKAIFIALLSFGAIPAISQVFTVDQPPVQNPNTGSNINTTTNNSNSGVNPNGNPATIINNSALSNKVNTTLSQQNLTPVAPGTANVNRGLVSDLPAGVPPPNTKVVVLDTRQPERSEDNAGVKIPVEETIPYELNRPPGAVSPPVLSTYVPQVAVDEIVKKYGNNIYDITRIKQQGGQVIYVVRVIREGRYYTEYVTVP